jgi:glycine cleavage system T protein (aminomethyltransferase)
MVDKSADQTLSRTPLSRLHEALGARIVPFAGYAMPVQYPTGIITEHTHTRTHAGLFDVSHMGQIRVSGEAAATALESLLPIDVVDLPRGRQRYGFLTNEDGGILDDLMVANLGPFFLVVVNAARKADDATHLASLIGDRCRIEPIHDRALLALQGPEAASVIGRLSTSVAAMRFMDVAEIELLGEHCYVSRSGYTGEDGFEISLPAAAAESFARTLLEDRRVAPIGLGARDTLRLEAGLCLYGQDIDATTTPVEASLEWALSSARRAEGPRAGGYRGADVILGQLAAGVARRRVGLLPDSRMLVRGGCPLVDANGDRVGIVTSGSFGPTLGAPVAMGYVATHVLTGAAAVAAIVRNARVPVTITRSPAVPHRYVRSAGTR